MEKKPKMTWEIAEDFILRLLLEKTSQEHPGPILEALYDRKEDLIKKLMELNEEIGRLSRVETNPEPEEDKPTVD